MKYVKEYYPLQLAEYYHQILISQEHEFSLWVPHLMKKRDRIIYKVRSKYETRTNKYGVRIPKSGKEEISLDKSNDNTLWWDAIVLEKCEDFF